MAMGAAMAASQPLTGRDHRMGVVEALTGSLDALETELKGRVPDMVKVAALTASVNGWTAVLNSLAVHRRAGSRP